MCTQSKRVAALAVELSFESNVELGVKAIVDTVAELLRAEHVLLYALSREGAGFEVCAASSTGAPSRHSLLGSLQVDLSVSTHVGAAALVRLHAAAELLLVTVAHADTRPISSKQWMHRI